MLNEPFLTKRNDLAAERIIAALERRHMEGYYAKNKEEALKIALSLIPEGAKIGWGGSFSIEEIGLKQAVKSGNYVCIDRDTAKTPEEREDLMRECLLTDVFLMGTNAISMDGQLVNIDGKGNRMAALCFGPKEVLVICGMNKVCKNLEEAIARTRSYAAPVNTMRFNAETACSKTGACADCTMSGCCCGQLVITRNGNPTGRIKVILVNEELGI